MVETKYLSSHQNLARKTQWRSGLAKKRKGVSYRLAMLHFDGYTPPMSRSLRLEIAGGLHHITSRGDRPAGIYHDDADRQGSLSISNQICKRFNWRIHAWCQMSNHYHLIIETVQAVRVSLSEPLLSELDAALANGAFDAA